MLSQKVTEEILEQHLQEQYGGTLERGIELVGMVPEEKVDKTSPGGVRVQVKNTVCIVCACLT